MGEKDSELWGDLACEAVSRGNVCINGQAELARVGKIQRFTKGLITHVPIFAGRENGQRGDKHLGTNLRLSG